MNMSQPSKIRPGQAGKHLAAAIVMGLSVAGSALAQHCPQPATPCPCAADGTCYPKRDTWGFYKTHWRVAPGDSIGIEPTPAAGETPEIRKQLEPYIRPLPEEEDLRGPAKPVRPAAPADQPAATAPAQQPPQGEGQPPAQEGEEAPAAAPADALDLPGLPGLGPQGSVNPLPRIEEGPPALPRALSAVLSSSPAQPSVGYATVAANPVTAVPAVKSTLPIANSRYVSPVSTANVGNIELRNPAAKNVQKTMDQDLQHAIYLESSELSQH
jgi:hypothetical protein